MPRTNVATEWKQRLTSVELVAYIEPLELTERRSASASRTASRRGVRKGGQK